MSCIYLLSKLGKSIGLSNDTQNTLKQRGSARRLPHITGCVDADFVHYGVGMYFQNSG